MKAHQASSDAIMIYAASEQLLAILGWDQVPARPIKLKIPSTRTFLNTLDAPGARKYKY